MGIALVRGRTFEEREISGGEPVALVNQAFVARHLPEVEPLGRIVRIPLLRSAPLNLDVDAFQIVGIVNDLRNRSLRNEPEPELYFPYTITGMADTLVVLAQTNPAALTRTIQAQVYAIDKDQPVTSVRTMKRLLQEWEFARPRFNLILFSVFAALGLILAVIGIYGVTSNSVSHRTPEIGVRIALGATSNNILSMVIGGGLKLLLAGIVLGSLGGLAAARLLSQQVWSVSLFDPLSFAAVSLIVLVAGIAACLRPARRASRVDPVTALRWE
jgi:putative ABC transport system permease protein